MIEVKEAARIAGAYLDDLRGPLEGIMLEEVEYDDSADEWLVTLSYLMSPPFSMREYKVFRIAASDGRVKSMKIRRVA